MAAMEQLAAVQQFMEMEPQETRNVLDRVWAEDPEIQEAMQPLIDEVKGLGVGAAADVALAIYLAIFIEEVRNGKGIEAG